MHRDVPVLWSSRGLSCPFPVPPHRALQALQGPLTTSPSLLLLPGPDFIFNLYHGW